MHRQPVKSSNIRSVGHDVASNTLEVEFVSGTVYRYEGVSRELAEGLLKADSVGSFFAKNVRKQFNGSEVEVGRASTDQT